MNTGPIIGGTRDGEQFSHSERFAEAPALLQLSGSPTAFDSVPMNQVISNEVLRWVPFYFSSPRRDVGFWVSLCQDTRNLREDSEYRMYVLMKLSERYIEDTPTIRKRLFRLMNVGL